MFDVDICENPVVLQPLAFVLKTIQIVYYIIPVVLIVFLTKDLLQNVIFADDDSVTSRNLKIFIKRIIMTVLLFLVPTIVSFFLGFIDDNKLLSHSILYTYKSCKENTKKVSFYQKNYEAKLAAYKEAQMQKQAERMANITEKIKKRKEYADEIRRKMKNNVTINDDNSSNNDNSVSSGVSAGQTYNLDDNQIKAIASLCQQEQGSPVGAAAEASLMANKYELINAQSKFKDLYDYVRNNNEASPGSWWLNAGTFMDKMNASSDVVAAVRDVLINGNRTLPLYINEHDAFSDIRDISTGSVHNRSDYKQDVTKIHTKWTTYTFYSFPTSSSDPFGYEDWAYKKINGGG